MKRFLFSLLFFTLLTVLFCIAASAEVYSGRALDEEYILNSGEQIEDGFVDPEFQLAGYYQMQYEMNTDTGVLRIFCSPLKNPQRMLPYAKGEWIPWLKDHMRPYIRKVIIEEGVLSVGRFVFYQCENLQEVYLPHSLMRIDQAAFYECPRLKAIYYPGKVSDFEKNVEYQDKLNSYTGAGKERKAIDLIVYGESVSVICKNQDGEIFDSYTVGGFNIGDAYQFSPRVYEGVTYVGKKQQVSGKFKKDDKTEYVFEYSCPHVYEFKDGTLICSSACIYCGCADPAYENEHEWAVKKDVKRGLFKDLELDKTCTVCGLTRKDHRIAYIWYVAAAAGGVAVLALVAILISIPIRKKKKMKELSW